MTSMTPAAFIAAILPAAQASSLKTKIPAAFTVAEAALESGWGGSELVTTARNLFGVKADTSWRGSTVMLPTKEFFKGTWLVVKALWRAYATWQECIDDHAQFLLTNPRYASALAVCDDVTAFTHAIAAAGYATDPNYATKILAVIHCHNLA